MRIRNLLESSFQLRSLSPYAFRRYLPCTNVKYSYKRLPIGASRREAIYRAAFLGSGVLNAVNLTSARNVLGSISSPCPVPPSSHRTLFTFSLLLPFPILPLALSLGPQGRPLGLRRRILRLGRENSYTQPTARPSVGTEYGGGHSEVLPDDTHERETSTRCKTTEGDWLARKRRAMIAREAWTLIYASSGVGGQDQKDERSLNS